MLEDQARKVSEMSQYWPKEPIMAKCESILTKSLNYGQTGSETSLIQPLIIKYED